MKIAFMIPEISATNGAGDGIRNQAWTWAAGLRDIGVTVDMISPWEVYDFRTYDLVHFFSYYPAMDKYSAHLKQKFGMKLAISPIIDSNRAPTLTRLASYFNCPRLHMFSPMGSLRESIPILDAVFVRSEYEGNYVRKAFGAPKNKIYKVMLSTRLPATGVATKRDDFCLLVSYMPSLRKNVFGLVNAAIKYKFRLVLAGGMTTRPQYEKLKETIKGHENITLLGWVPDEQLLSLYQKARVFALPSFMEGVGLVALEAAANGCDVVLTNRGAPKEYYNGMVRLVDPTSIDDIGRAIVEFLEGKTFQPQLGRYISETHSARASAKDLYESYCTILGR